MVLEKTLESPLDSKEIKPVNPKENKPKIFIGGMMLRLKLQHFGHLMQRADSLEKTLMLGKIEGGGEGDDRGWHHQLNGHESGKLREMVMDREVWHAAVYGGTKNQT